MWRVCATLQIVLGFTRRGRVEDCSFEFGKHRRGTFANGTRLCKGVMGSIEPGFWRQKQATLEVSRLGSRVDSEVSIPFPPPPPKGSSPAAPGSRFIPPPPPRPIPRSRPHFSQEELGGEPFGPPRPGPHRLQPVRPGSPGASPEEALASWAELVKDLI